jgi:hypothetical protein
MSAIHMQLRLKELHAERVLAMGEGLAPGGAYITNLDDEIAATCRAYTIVAVTEIATLRAELFGPQVG